MKYLNYEYRDDVLYDEHNQKISEEECFNGIPQCRITSPEMFKPHVTSEMRRLFPDYSHNLVGNSEIAFHYLNDFRYYKNKKLLIVGGGPTTNKCNWENLDFDYVWSCNFFYRHPKLKNIPVDLAMVGQEINIGDRDFINYCINNNTKLGFEIAGKFYQTNMGSNFDHLNRQMKVVPNYKLTNHFCFFTRYYGWIGANWRQMILALFLGFKEIYFVGMDGYSFKTGPETVSHSFQPGKIPKGGPMKPGAKEAFRQHLIIFWNYVLNRLKPDVKFYNLGEFSEDNMTREISKQYFPLPDNIKETIGVKY